MKKTVKGKEIVKNQEFVDDPDFRILLKLMKEILDITDEPKYFTVDVPCEVSVEFNIENGRVYVISEVEDVDADNAETDAENLPEVEKIIQTLAKTNKDSEEIAKKLAKKYKEDYDDILCEAEDIVSAVAYKWPDCKILSKKYKDVFKK